MQAARLRVRRRSEQLEPRQLRRRAVEGDGLGGAFSGRVLYRIPDPLEMKGTSAAEGVAVDAMGNVYGGEVGPRQLVKHIRQ